MSATVEYLTPTAIPPVLREALYCHEILRTAGAAAADIFTTWDQASARLGVVVKVAGELVLTAVYGPVEFPDAETFAAAWQAAVRLWNATCQDPAAGWDFQGSDSRAHAVEIMSAWVVARTQAERTRGANDN